MTSSPQAPGIAWGLLLLRVAVGGMLFWIHGVHKLEGGLYVLAVASLALMGGGRWSLDAAWTRGASAQATAAPA